jgi:hypothetical protein
MSSSCQYKEPYVIQSASKTQTTASGTYQLTIWQTRPSAIELDLADIEICLEDLSCVTPCREICNGVCLVRDWVPELDALGHLGLTDASIGIIARVQTTGRRMMVPEHYYAGVER